MKPNVGQQFVAVYDGYAMSMTVVAITGSLLTLDDDGEQCRKRPGVDSNGLPYFKHHGHVYRYQVKPIDIAQHNRLKL